MDLEMRTHGRNSETYTRPSESSARRVPVVTCMHGQLAAKASMIIFSSSLVVCQSLPGRYDSSEQSCSLHGGFPYCLQMETFCDILENQTCASCQPTKTKKWDKMPKEEIFDIRICCTQYSFFFFCLFLRSST